MNEELIEWKGHPFTQRFFNFLHLLEESAKEDWAMEEFVGTSLEEMALRNAKALGGIKVLKALQDIEMQDIIDAEKERDEQVRNQGRRLDSAG